MSERARNLHKHWGVSEKRREKVERREQEVREVLRDFKAYRDPFMASVNALRSGDAETRLRALAHLTNTRPDVVLEEMIAGIATDGAAAPRAQGVDPTVRELQEQVRRLTEEQERATKQAQQQQAVAQLRSQLQAAVADADRWPTLARDAAPDRDGAMRQVYDYMAAKGLTVGQACNEIELLLQRQSKRAAAQPAEAKPRPAARRVVPSRAAVHAAEPKSANGVLVKDEDYYASLAELVVR